MISVDFKNVGQGDSIFLEWTSLNQIRYGIIDCHIYNNTNPILEEVVKKKVSEIEFIILTHFHHDHFSGFADLLNYCISHKIRIKRFLHTFKTDYYRILDSQFTSKKIQKDIESFWNTFENAFDIIEDISDVTNTYTPVVLYNGVALKFLSPNGKDSIRLVKQQVNFDNKISSTKPNFNTVATIIQITNDSKSILFTSDAVKGNFHRIGGKISEEMVLIQVPHHGSDKNHSEIFWDNIKKIPQCPSVFSVGNVKRDKIPKKNVVEYFDKQGYYNVATNFVYGLAEYYGSPISTTVNKKSLLLSKRSVLRATTVKPPVTSPRFFGNKSFSISL